MYSLLLYLTPRHISPNPDPALHYPMTRLFRQCCPMVWLSHLLLHGVVQHASETYYRIPWPALWSCFFALVFMTEDS